VGARQHLVFRPILGLHTITASTGGVGVAEGLAGMADLPTFEQFEDLHAREGTCPRAWVPTDPPGGRSCFPPRSAAPASPLILPFVPGPGSGHHGGATTPSSAAMVALFRSGTTHRRVATVAAVC